MGGSAQPMWQQPIRGSPEPQRMPRSYIPVGSAEPMMPMRGSYMPMRGSVEPMSMMPGPMPVRRSAYPQTAFSPPPMQQSLMIPKEPEIGGVGIVFTDHLDTRGVNEVLVKKVWEGGPADRSGKIKVGDVLSDVNGEDVYMRSSKEIHRLIPGKIGSIVVLGFRSADNSRDYYEVELNREETRKLGEMTIGELNKDFEATDGDDFMDYAQPVGPQASPGLSLQKDEDLAGVYVVANVTPGSSAEQCGFQHGEIIEAIDNVSCEGWTERRLLKVLSGPYKTLVQIHTNMRVVPVVRDCRSLLDPPRPA
eukprot:CAMPEP_0181298362 /NCGR_PEP_ID=MMETSP1101-20121128/5740_1 /TAXON_ID=46948 /ORGANISM="Rhodomonas abbreviata, Strain Caron Lab Isolate" /LENGTH=306 /DNA_ID=CAMNT_0023403375 /DNA_START=69 /DNA_END=985 /DNA_ORIENTATION=+